MDSATGFLRQIIEWLPGAHIAYSVVTVILMQIVKRLFFPSDPNAPIGKWMHWTTPERFGRWILLLTFVVAATLSITFDPHGATQGLRGKIGDGLQTAAGSVAMWEVYSKWIRPRIFPEEG